MAGDRPGNSIARRTIGRRTIGRRTVLGAAAVSLAGCDAPEVESGPRLPGVGEPFPDPSATPDSYNESPLLAERVDAGDLPKVADRLPASPYVVRPDVLVASDYMDVHQGTYGGTLQLAQEQPDYDPVIFLGNIEPLLWAPEGFNFDAGVQGNVVADYEVNRDSSEFVFHMREGLRWSDGEPVTMADVEFAFNDVLLNEDITPVLPEYLHTGKDPSAPPAELVIIDDWTFALQFAAGYGGFISQIAIADWISYADLIKPKHYLAQFHPKYASREELLERMEAESIPEGQWFSLFRAVQLVGSIDKVTSEQGIGHPTLTAWTMVEAQTGVLHYERNPYYFKVDPNGNQLPYIDRLRSQTVQDQATLTARALMGDFDYAGERASLRQLPLITAQERRGELKLSVARMHRLPICFFLNLTYEDELWRTVVRNVRFRQALSLAINRQEIIDNFFLGEFASLPEETNPPDYDVDRAERILDEIGMDQRDQQGYRLGPDGERFVIPFEIGDQAEDFIPMSQLIAEYWNHIGVHTTVRAIDLGVHSDRRLTNDLRATALWAAHDIWPSAANQEYLPTDNYGPLWQDWFTSGGERGEEPPEQIRQLFRLHGEFLSAIPGSEQAQEVYEQILRSHYENVWLFTPAERSYYPTFFSTRVRNVPEGIKDDMFGVVCNIAMAQWYIDDR